MDYLELSANRRYFMLHDGTPFFWLADTAWELAHRLTENEARLYFQVRSDQGFNISQIVMISEFDGLRSPDPTGELPFNDLDTLIPNEKYFNRIATFIEIAASYGIYLALIPTWGDKVDRRGWGIGPEIWTPSKIYAYGEWLGRKFYKYRNIIWVNGGDRPGNGKNWEIWNALAEGIRKYDKIHLMTFHPWGETSSSFWFHEAEWLDFNSCQSGHSARSYPNYMMVESDYCRTPAKPCIDMEPRYEQHPVNWKPENKLFDDYDVRQAAWQAVFSGAAGHSYGAHPIWQMCPKPDNNPGSCQSGWKDSLFLPGACQMKWLKNLIMSRPYFERLPDQFIIGSPKSGDEHICACRGKSYLMVYFPNGGTHNLNLELITGGYKKLYWYNPRTGSSIYNGTIPSSEKTVISAPSSLFREDWVLVADNHETDFPLPGSILTKKT